MPRLLAVYPHPDDETWISGALLARAAAAGWDVRVVSLSEGEAGWDRTGTHSDPAAIAAMRRDEFHHACDALGLPNRGIGSLTDGAISVEAATAFIRAELEAYQPVYLLTFGADGGYGHVDHITSHAAADAALSNESFRNICWFSAMAASGRVERIWRMLARLSTERPLVVDDFHKRRRAATQQPTISLPTEEFRQTKRSALSCYRSQLKDGDPESFLDQELITSLLDEEMFAFEAGNPKDFGQLFQAIDSTSQ
jgi:N-acetyl-1-D-myo-inositol-2-amino-2-deoxy-alpha-D-glucopyranoside deacetylase